MNSIRKYKKSDYSIIETWWKQHGEIAPKIDFLPKDSTYILEHNNIPLLSVSIFYIKGLKLCYLENFIGDPLQKGNIRKEAGKEILQYVLKKARDNGYKYAVGYSFKEKLSERYKEMGFKLLQDNIKALAISCLE